MGSIFEVDAGDTAVLGFRRAPVVFQRSIPSVSRADGGGDGCDFS